MQMLDGLPNCVFDASGPLRQYSKQARAAGFLAKAAELSAVGALMGTVTSLLSTAAVAVRRRSNPEWQPSTEVANAGRSSAGMAAFFALNANTRCACMQHTPVLHCSLPAHLDPGFSWLWGRGIE